MAEWVDRALSASSGIGGPSAFGLLFKRRQRAANPGSAFAASAWSAVIEECDFKIGGAPRSTLYPVAQPVVGERGRGISVSGCHRVAGEDRPQGDLGAGVGGSGSERGRAEGDLGFGTFSKRVDFVLGRIFRGSYPPWAQAAVLSDHGREQGTESRSGKELAWHSGATLHRAQA